MRQTIDQLREENDSQVEQDGRDWAEHKEKHDRLREDARKELGMPEPKTREQESIDRTAVTDIVHDRYRNEVIDMRGPVEPEQTRDKIPAFEPDTYVPEHYAEADFDREMGD